MDKLKEKLEEGYVLVLAIIEIAGRPREHIENTMKLVIDKIKEEDGLILTKGQAFKTKEVDVKKEKMYSSFAELEILMKDRSRIAGFCFDYMPSSIEILQPLNLKFGLEHYTEMLNDLLTKLHNMDMVIKNVRAENKILTDNASALLRNLFIHTLKKKERSIDEMSKLMGIPAPQLQNLAEDAIKQKLIKKVDDKYMLAQ